MHAFIPKQALKMLSQVFLEPEQKCLTIPFLIMNFPVVAMPFKWEYKKENINELILFFFFNKTLVVRKPTAELIYLCCIL